MEPLHDKYLRLAVRLRQDRGGFPLTQNVEIYDVDTGAILPVESFEIGGDMGGYEEEIAADGTRIKRERHGRIVALTVRCLASFNVVTDHPFQDRGKHE